MPHNINYDISFIFIFTGKGNRNLADIRNTAFKKYSVQCTFTINTFSLSTNK